MSLIWWDHGAFASLGFPALATADDKLVSLGAPEAQEEVLLALRSTSSLADIILYYMNQPFTPNVCFQAANYLTIIYFKCRPAATLLKVFDSALDTMTLPPSIPGTTSIATLIDMARNYAKAIDLSVHEWERGKEEGALIPMAQALRTASHAMYGYHAVMNTLAIASGSLPLSASAYVNVESRAVGPTMLHAFFLGPDGEADPETLLFAPALATFVKPLDAILSGVLLSLSVEWASAFFPDAQQMWNLSSNINATFRKKNIAPKMGRARVQKRSEETDSQEESALSDLLDD